MNNCFIDFDESEVGQVRLKTFVAYIQHNHKIILGDDVLDESFITAMHLGAMDYEDALIRTGFWNDIIQKEMQCDEFGACCGIKDGFQIFESRMNTIGPFPPWIVEDIDKFFALRYYSNSDIIKPVFPTRLFCCKK